MTSVGLTSWSTKKREGRVTNERRGRAHHQPGSGLDEGRRHQIGAALSPGPPLGNSRGRAAFHSGRPLDHQAPVGPPPTCRADSQAIVSEVWSAQSLVASGAGTIWVTAEARRKLCAASSHHRFHVNKALHCKGRYDTEFPHASGLQNPGMGEACRAWPAAQRKEKKRE